MGMGVLDRDISGREVSFLLAETLFRSPTSATKQNHVADRDFVLASLQRRDFLVIGYSKMFAKSRLLFRYDGSCG